MSEPSTARHPARLLLHGLLLLVGVWLAFTVVKLAVTKAYSVNEFQYGHGAWLVSQGEVIYRDFWEAHFPLIHQVMAVPLTFADDDPRNLIYLRLAMLPVLALLVGAAWFINGRRDRLTGFVTPLVLLGTGALASLGVEVRPDTLAFALFLASIALLYAARPGPRARGFLAGLLLTLALWGSQKVFYYGMAVVAAFVADLVSSRRGARGRLLGDWRTFAAGSVTVLFAIAAYLTVTTSWDDFFRWGLSWSFLHQKHYPGFPWLQNFLPFLAHHTWLFVFATVGVVQTVRARWGVEKEPADHPDLILVALLVTTLFSAAWQTAPYLYSFIPFMAMLGIFAARGIVGSFRWFWALGERRPALRVYPALVLSLLLLGELLHVRTLFATALLNDNAAQNETLRRVGELTDPGDAIFDIAGKRMTRPGVHFFYFTDAVIRNLWADTLATEIPAGILEKGATLYLHDPRFNSLPPVLQAFLITNFQPLDNEIWIWGRRYENPMSGELEDTFFAVRDGDYFVYPTATLSMGSLTIDGRAPSGPVFRLAKGPHEVRFSGAPGSFKIMWLPRNGERFAPREHTATNPLGVPVIPGFKPGA